MEGDINWTAVTILIIIVLLFTIFFTYIFLRYSLDCMEEIAQEYCKKNDMVFTFVDHTAPHFSCSIDDRTYDRIKFKFTLEEKNSCKRFLK